MNGTALRIWLLLIWMMAAFGIGSLSLAQQAGPDGTTPVTGGRRISAPSGDNVSLTPQERQWLSRHDGLIRIGITMIPPQVIGLDGRYKGLSIDYIRLMERKLGCRFKLVPYATWNELIQAARARRIDMIFAAQQTPERLEYLLFSESYIDLPHMIFVRRERPGGADLKDMQGWRVATSEGSAVHEDLKRQFPDLDLYPVPDELSGLIKVSVGEVDAMVVEISRASYYIEKTGILNLRVSGSAGLLYRLRFAVRNDWSMLRGILDKGLAAVTDEERRAISRRWIVVGERHVFAGKAFWILLAAGLAVISLAVAGVVVWNRALRKVVRQRTWQLQQELAEREKAEDALVRLNRQLRAISTCNMVLMQASDEQSLLDEICRIVCDEAGYRMAWVGYPQKDDARTIRPMARAGVEEGYLAEAGITWAETEQGLGPAGRAIRDGVSACFQDFATDPHAAPWRESALQRGYRSSIALPLKGENGIPFGVLCIYSAQPGSFTPEEMKLLDELAENLAFGIATLRIRAAHKKSETQIVASEQLFRALVENSPDFIARYDRECRRIYVNPAIQKLFAGRPKNVLGKTPADHSPLYAPQIYIDHLRRVIETATESAAEMPFRTAHGEMHWGHIRFVPEFGPDGHVVSVLTIGRDIHEIKENEQRFRMLAENFPDFVARFDRDGHYTFVNPAIEKAFGLPAEAIIGKSLRELPQGRKAEQNDALLGLIRRAFDEGVANESEAAWDTEIGERIYEIRHAPEKDATGSVFSVLGIARDITERKQIEQERFATLRFFESMDRINRAARENNDIEQMMSDVLDVVLLVLECDRASLVYPCDPEAAAWSALMERTKPEWPGALALGIEVPVDPEVARVYKAVLASSDPVGFGPGNEYPLPTDVAERFNEHSQLAAALYPKEDKPYMFVIHQCSRPRVWTKEERGLFKEIGKRLEDALTHLIMHRNLLDSEERYRLVFEHSPVPIWEEDFSAVKTLFDDLKKQGVVDIEAHFDRHPEAVRQCAESAKIVDVNRAALALHGAANKEALLAGLVHTFTAESFDTFRRELECLWNGGTEMASDTVVMTLAGERRKVTVYFAVCPGHEQTFAKVLVSLVDITERKRIEEALSTSEAELRTLIRAMTDVIIVSNSEGRYLKIVDTSPSLLYKPPNELLGKTLHEVFPNDQADFFLNKIRQALNTQQSVNFEYSLPIGNKDLWFNATISPLYDDKILMVARDITQGKQSEEVLRNTALRLNEAQRLAHIGNWELNLKDNLLSWSDEIFRIFEIDPDQFGASYEAFLDAVHPEDREAVDFAYTHSLETRTPYSIDHRLLIPDGRVKYVHEQCETYYEGDKPVRSIGTVQDITERIRAEEKIKASEERLRLTLEATQIGLWDWDVTNDRYYASPIYYTMLGYEPEKGPADRSVWVQRLHPDDKEFVLKEVDKVLSERSAAYSYEARFRHADGTYRWQWAFGCGSEYDQNGKVTRMLGLRIDIDDRKRMEEELSIYRGHLEELVRERTTELEAANKELDAFAYSVSHDLRAPLRHIDGFLELLEKRAGTVMDDQSRHYMDTISHSAKKMGRLIDDLLSFSRMGRQAMSFEQVALEPLVHDIIQELEPDAAGRDITWRIGDLPAVDGDASMLRMVLANLISNALKFTQSRQQARIEIGSLAGQGSEAVIFVRDNGVGFDMAYADKLFGVFQRLHRQEDFEGTGIGLASVRRIIARHGGRTWAEGKADQGATFYFSLP